MILFLERLELYVSSGLSVDRSLQIIEDDSPAKYRESVRRMRISIESGRPLADSASGMINLPQTAAGLIRHGESSGRLAQSVMAARTMLEHGEELKKKLGSAMAYPVIIGAFASLLTLGLVRGVMPQIIPMLESLHVPLPVLTRAVIALSQGFISYGAYGGLASVGLIAAVLFLYKRSAKAKYLSHWLIMRIPIAGRLSADYSISIFLQSCGSLIETGSPAADSYRKSAASVSLMPLRSIFQSKVYGLERGTVIHAAFKDRAIPGFIPSLLSAGESSGTLGASMLRAAAILDRDIDHSLKRLTALVEPLMMAGMGLAVGSIALSIMMPIYDISKVLQK